jgi:hypothetical protein
MSWPLVHVHECVRVRINFSLNLFLSETTTPRELIFGRNVPWVVPFKFVHRVLKFCVISEQEVKKTAKNSLIFKILFSKTIGARSKQKAVS